MRTRMVDVSARELFAVVNAYPAWSERLEPGELELMQQAPVLLRLLHRAAFDLALPPPSRHLAAAAALYLQEPVDFLAERPNDPMGGMVDNVYVAWRAFGMLLQRHGHKALVRLAPREEVVDGLVRSTAQLDTLAARLPPRVLDLADRYLGITAGRAVDA